MIIINEIIGDRIPPQNIEAEQAVLGAIFLQPSSLTLASELLIPEDFYRASHQKIYNAMLELSDKGEPVDLVTVTSVSSECESFRRDWRSILFK